MDEQPVPPALADLTAAELRVAVAVGRGLSNRAAADELFLSVKTVDHHLQRIYRKLDLRSRAELAVLVTRALVDTGAGREQPFLASLAEQPDLLRLRGSHDPLAGFDDDAGHPSDLVRKRELGGDPAPPESG
ncbi:MAG: hypothetical protein AVDCRST_MAG76-3656 [uncultured Acidimicrobiales bacterium]|uniref:HTH luxR-type domain-containing protein n=1 Tax=uncultured Acidimicrobiales bacterium TaxID=310071 RepID=A0A6J4JCN5_9ACTN|nr:MAG: hypothetical protein AVDCRST_MAG76-3656 [uncultured Acidimicrobiales bacterium]